VFDDSFSALDFKTDSALRQFSQPINQVTNIANIMQATMAAAQRVFEFLDAKEEVKIKL